MLGGKKGMDSKQGYTICIICKYCGKTPTLKPVCAPTIVTDTKRRNIRTNRDILQGVINQISRINHSFAFEEAGEAERQKMRLSLSLFPYSQRANPS